MTSGSDEKEFEIERRFLVQDTSIIEGCSWELITQAYIFSMDDYAVRVRIKQTERPTPDDPNHLDDIGAELTVKGPRLGLDREEYPLTLPMAIARAIVARSANVIVKKRYHVPEGEDLTWEVDEFFNENIGLWIAEIEGLDRDKIAAIRRPVWASTEVTTDSAYNNENLAVRPFVTWAPADDSPYDD
jgi:adenylate cyclase